MNAADEIELLALFSHFVLLLSVVIGCYGFEKVSQRFRFQKCKEKKGLFQGVFLISLKFAMHCVKNASEIYLKNAGNGVFFERLAAMAGVEDGCYDKKMRAWRWGRAMEAAVARLIREGRSPFKNALILAQNYVVKGGELDLVIEADGVGGRTLWALEIRARGVSREGLKMVHPMETIGSKKQQRIRRTLKVFLESYSGPATEMALVLVAVTLKPDGAHAEFREF